MSETNLNFQAPADKKSFFQWAVSQKLCSTVQEYNPKQISNSDDFYNFLFVQRGTNGQYAAEIIKKATEFITSQGIIIDSIKELFDLPNDCDLTRDLDIIIFW